VNFESVCFWVNNDGLSSSRDHQVVQRLVKNKGKILWKELVVALFDDNARILLE
jgi:hypothetical protein